MCLSIHLPSKHCWRNCFIAGPGLCAGDTEVGDVPGPPSPVAPLSEVCGWAHPPNVTWQAVNGDRWRILQEQRRDVLCLPGGIGKSNTGCEDWVLLHMGGIETEDHAVVSPTRGSWLALGFFSSSVSPGDLPPASSPFSILFFSSVQWRQTNRDNLN